MRLGKLFLKTFILISSFNSYGVVDESLLRDEMNLLRKRAFLNFKQSEINKLEKAEEEVPNRKREKESIALDNNKEVIDLESKYFSDSVKTKKSSNKK